MKKPQVKGTSGAALVSRIRAEMAEGNLEPDAKEAELLRLAEALQDRIVQLEQAIAAEGLTTVSKSGVVHLHPAVTEARQTRAQLARVLASVSMQADDAKDPKKVKAAQTRWRSHNEAKRARGA